MKRLIIYSFGCSFLILSSCAKDQTTVTQNQDEIGPDGTEIGDMFSTPITDDDKQEVVESAQDTQTSKITSSPQPSPTATFAYPTLELPDRELSTNGPWLIVSADPSIYAFNSDGSGKTLLIDSYVSFRYSISQFGANIAYLMDVDPESATDGEQLRLFNIATGQDRLITDLQDSSLVQPDDLVNMQSLTESARAITYGPPSWSHNGKYLAFIGQQNGISADLYLYNLENDQVSRLTDGPFQAHSPEWSPNDRYIFHNASSTFGTGAGIDNMSNWVVNRDGDKMVEITTDPSLNRLKAWQNSERFLIAHCDIYCGCMNLQSYQIQTGEITIIWPYQLGSVHYDTSTGKIFIVASPYEDCGIDEGRPEGLYMIDELGAAPRLIPGADAEWVRDDPSHPGSYLLFSSDGTYRLSPAGNIEMVQDVRIVERRSLHEIYSMQAGLFLWFGLYEDSSGLWIGDYSTEPHKIFDHPVAEAIWSISGDRIYFISYEDDLLYLADGPAFSPYIFDSEPLPSGRWDKLYWVEQ